MDKFISKVNIEDLNLLCDPKKLKKKDILLNSEKSDKELILTNKDINKFKEIMKEKIDNFNNKNSNDRYYILIEALWHKYISENIDFMEYSKNSIGGYSRNDFLESLIIDNKFDILGNVNI